MVRFDFKIFDFRYELIKFNIGVEFPFYCIIILFYLLYFFKSIINRDDVHTS